MELFLQKENIYAMATLCLYTGFPRVIKVTPADAQLSSFGRGGLIRST